MHTVDIKDFARFMGLSMLSKGISVSPLKLQKLLYYQQAWHMVFFGRNSTLFDEAPQAWVNGPVYPAIYMQYKNCVPGMCDHLRSEDFGVAQDAVLDALKKLADKLALTESEMDLFDSVINLYGSKTQNQLIFMTHAELPWSEQREGLEPYEKSNRPISLDTMYSYYKARYDSNRGRA
ncbi:MAG: DUF4065 domain-containing protein [Bacteroidales bacterium]|nr:DUF4065 domain-containing protein [Bacteroidales bacterium]